MISLNIRQTDAPQGSARSTPKPMIRRVNTSITTMTQWLRRVIDSQRSRVERQRRTALPPPVSDVRSPNRTCTFRYASGSPGTKAKRGVCLAPLIKFALNAEEPDFISPFIRVHGCFLRLHNFIGSLPGFALYT